jgi:hypothetical protein
MKFVIASLFLSTCSIVANAQQNTISNIKTSVVDNSQTKKYHLKDIKNLDSLSDIYFKMGDDQFLVIDAYKDGLVKTNGDATFKYENNILTLNGKFIPEPYNSNYLGKIKNVQSREGILPGSKTRILLGPGAAPLTEDVFVYEPIDNIKMFSGQPGFYSYPAELKRFHSDSILVKTLFANNIIPQNTTSIRLRYNAEKIYVNNIELTNMNVLAVCRQLLAEIQPPDGSSPDDYFGIYFNKNDLKRFCAIK